MIPSKQTRNLQEFAPCCGTSERFLLRVLLQLKGEQNRHYADSFTIYEALLDLNDNSSTFALRAIVRFNKDFIAKKKIRM